MTRDMNDEMLRQRMHGGCTEGTRSCAPCASFASFCFAHRVLRFAAVVLMMVVGVSGVKAQLGVDYSGVYYIASDYQTQNTTTRNYDPNTLSDNYYLCPTENWISFGSSGETMDTWTTGNDKPFLTTYKARKHANTYELTKAKWTIEYYATESDGKDYYYIKHSSGKYLVLNKQINGVEGNNMQYRIRVHLETLTPTDLDNQTTRNSALFAISRDGRSYVIDPKTQSQYYLTVNKGNGDYLQGENRNSGATITSGSTTYGLAGTIGIYKTTGTDDNKYLYLEDYITRPTISYSSGNEVTITYPTSATVYYTTDGSDPTDSGNQNRSSFETSQTVTFTTVTFTNVAVIKAAAYINGEYSNIASYTYFYTGSKNPYLLQSVENTNFYMTVGDVNSSSQTTVNTSSFPQEGMSWYLKDAGTTTAGAQCYYVCNTSGGYLRRNNNTFYINETKEDHNDYKFEIIPYLNESGILAGFNLYNIGKKQYVYKSPANNVDGNGSNGVVNLSADGSQVVARWNPVLVSNRDFSLPIIPSDMNSTTYYTFTSSQFPDYLITTPSGTAVNVMVSTGESDNQKWYFQYAGSNEWASYYYILNAVTGEAIYFNGTEATSTQQNAFIMKSLSEKTSGEEGNENNFMFSLAKTIGNNEYYIIPKPLAQFTKSNYSAVWCWGEGTLQTQSNRVNDRMKWQINQANFCMPPVFAETGTTITLSCPTNGAEIHYTDDGSTPDANTTNVVDAGTSWSSSTQHGIKAFAVVKDGETVTASSVVVTLLNKPDITLSQSTYTYNGGENKPTVNAVSIGTITAAVSAYSVPIYSADVTNVGTPTVTVTDADASDNLYIWNASTTFTINQKEVGLTWTPDPATFTYNGAGQSPTATTTGLIGSDDCTVTIDVSPYSGSSLTNGNAVNVGSYMATASALSNTNYKLPDDKTLDFSITQRPVTITAGSETKEYDGDPLTKNSYTYTDLATGDVITNITVSGSQTEKGSSDNVPSAAVIKNGDGDDVTECYDITYVNGTLTVTGRAITITADGDSKVYDGTALTKNSYTYDGTLFSGDAIESVTVTGSQTIVGSSDNVPSAAVIKNGDSEDVTANYTITYVSGTLEVTPKAVTITAERASKTYDGLALTHDGFTTTELEIGDTHTFTVTMTSESTITDVGNTPNVIATVDGVAVTTGTETTVGNYLVTTADGKLTVFRKAVTITANDKSKVYDGTALTEGGFTTTELEEGDTHTFTVVMTAESTITDVGTQSNVIATVDGATVTTGVDIEVGNYYVTTADGTLTINPASVTLTANSRDTDVYDGTEKTVSGFTCSVNGLTFDGVSASGSGTDAGSYNVTFTGVTVNTTTDTSGNYVVTGTINGTLTINEKSIGDGTVLAADITISISGGEITIEGLTVGTDFTVSDPSDEGGYQVWTVTGIGNYIGGAQVMLVNLDFYETGEEPTSTIENVKDVAAFQAPTDMAVTGKDVYIVIGANLIDKVVNIQKIDYAPEGVPVLLLDDLSGTPDANLAINSSFTTSPIQVSTAADVSQNILTRVTEDGGKVVGFGEVYMFFKGRFVLASNGTLPVGSYYFNNPNPLSISGGNSAGARLRIVIGETTRIDDEQFIVDNPLRDEVWYTIEGRRLSSKPTKKGLYIKRPQGKNGSVTVIK